MKFNQINKMFCVLAALSGCSTNVEERVSKPLITFEKTNSGWLSSQPLTSLYSYQLIDVRGQEPKVVNINDTDGGLRDYDVVFIGENHRHPGNHLAQTMIYQRMLAGNNDVILSMEQFERDTQKTVDAYLAGEIGEWTLRHFGRAWDNYQSSYRPLVEMAKALNLPVIAANAPKDTVVCTGRNGLEVLEKLPKERKDEVAASFHIPEEGDYFEKFAGAMSHGSSRSKASLNSYHAQVVRDDTMAESIHLAMQAHPDHKIVHLNGHFHSASGLGTVERLKLRNDSQIAVIQPILVNDPITPSFKYTDMDKGDYLLLIYPLSPMVITDENKRVWREKVFKRSKQDCSFGTDKA